MPRGEGRKRRQVAGLRGPRANQARRGDAPAPQCGDVVPQPPARVAWEQPVRRGGVVSAFMAMSRSAARIPHGPARRSPPRRSSRASRSATAARRRHSGLPRTRADVEMLFHTSRCEYGMKSAMCEKLMTPIMPKTSVRPVDHEDQVDARGQPHQELRQDGVDRVSGRRGRETP